MSIETGALYQTKHNAALTRIRILCVAVSLLLIVCSVAETWYMLESWFSGEAFQEIYGNYARYYPEIAQSAAGGWGVYILTMLVDLCGFIPYYLALVLIAQLFYKLRDGDILEGSIVRLLKASSLLLVVDACFPAVRDTLQVFIFTFSSSHPVLVLTMGLSSGGIRLFIVAMGLYATALILRQCKTPL